MSVIEDDPVPEGAGALPPDDAPEGASPLPFDDVAALFDELTLGDAPSERGPEVRSFALGEESFRPAERLTGLERMGEKMARAIRSAIEPMFQVRTQVSPDPLTTLRFDEWMAPLPHFMSLSHYRLRPLKGGTLIAIQSDFVETLIERFYGGTGAMKATASKSRIEFSASEDLLLSRLLEKLVGILVQHWCEVTPVEASLAQRESSSAHIGFVRSDDVIVVQSFTVSPADGEATQLQFLYPLAMLRPIEEQMAMRVHDDPNAGNGAWKQQLAAALEQVELPVRTVLARPEITVSALMALKAGDVIPIQLSPQTPLLVASRPIACGAIGEQEGRAALMIERIG